MIARAVISGNVQGIGYRSFVKNLARQMQIKGYVKNLDNGTVEVYAEAEKGKLEELVNKATEESHAKVENVEITSSQDKIFVKPKKKLGVFEIEYGKTDLMKESVERLEIGTALMLKTNKNTEKTNETVGKTHELMENFMNNTGSNFKELDVKYGSVSGKLYEISTKIDKLADALILLANRVTKG